LFGAVRHSFCLGRRWWPPIPGPFWGNCRHWRLGLPGQNLSDYFGVGRHCPAASSIGSLLFSGASVKSATQQLTQRLGAVDAPLGSNLIDTANLIG
jgi:hypothetical protein